MAIIIIKFNLIIIVILDLKMVMILVSAGFVMMAMETVPQNICLVVQVEAI